jgi:hypothetical protein
MVRVEKEYRFEGPEDVPQDPTGSWTRRHDSYTPEELARGRTS